MCSTTPEKNSNLKGNLGLPTSSEWSKCPSIAQNSYKMLNMIPCLYNFLPNSTSSKLELVTTLRKKVAC